MAKLNAPLFSFAASGKIANALVYFGWKGLNVVRQYVVPANPDTKAQSDWRDIFTAAVTAIHTAQGLATKAMAQIDQTAMALWGSCYPTPRTWFNQIVKNWLDQEFIDKHSSIFHGCDITGGDTIITINLYFTDGGTEHITKGYFWYGTSKTALVNSVLASMYSAPYLAIGDLSGLVNGKKYFVQFRPTEHADFLGVRSGIYYATPVAP